MSESGSSAPPDRARRRSSACCCVSTTCRQGRITVDGVDIREIDLADLRSLFGLVLQDVQLFAGTIARQRPPWQRVDQR